MTQFVDADEDGFLVKFILDPHILSNEKHTHTHTHKTSENQNIVKDPTKYKKTQNKAHSSTNGPNKEIRARQSHARLEVITSTKRDL